MNSPDVSSTLDRINLSDRKFTLLAAAIARANDEDINKDCLSRATVQRKRSANRNLISNQLQMEFQSRDRCLLVIHWDG